MILSPVSSILKISKDGDRNGSKIYSGTQAEIYKNPPEGMTAKLVKNMSGSDLLDMHYKRDILFQDSSTRKNFYRTKKI